MALKSTESAPGTIDIRGHPKQFKNLRQCDHATERGEEVQQASKIFVDPFHNVASVHPADPSGSQRFPPDTQSQEKLLESKRLLGNVRHASTAGQRNVFAAESPKFMVPSQRNSTQQMRHIVDSMLAPEKNKLALPSLPLHRDSKTGASLVPRPVSSKTWSVAQQEMFNPHNFNNAGTGGEDDANDSGENPIIAAPRRVSHF